MPEKWTGDLIGRMHCERVTLAELGNELGFGKAYVSLILNGRRKVDGMQERFEAALEAILKRREEEATA